MSTLHPPPLWEKHPAKWFGLTLRGGGKPRLTGAAKVED
jgi:hypothetical protein